MTRPHEDPQIAERAKAALRQVRGSPKRSCPGSTFVGWEVLGDLRKNAEPTGSVGGIKPLSLLSLIE